jgi:hypothetical protein
MSIERSERAKLIEARAEPTDYAIFPAWRSLLRHRRRLRPILRSASPSTPNNKRDEAQQPPSNTFCDAQLHYVTLSTPLILNHATAGLDVADLAFIS